MVSLHRSTVFQESYNSEANENSA